MNETLQSLLTPLFLCVSDYRRLANAGITVEMDIFRADIEKRIEKIGDAAAKNKPLAREYARIERALAFFIDFMVKESSFSFRDQWRNFARKYQELSGDEKFFEILDDVLLYADSADTVIPFYTMLGLGFTGVYQDDPSTIEKYLNRCAEKIADTADIRVEHITAFPIQKRSSPKKRSLFQKYKGFFISGGFAVISLIAATIVFFIITADFRDAVGSAGTSSVFYYANQAMRLPELRSVNPPPKKTDQTVGADSQNSGSGL